MPSDEIATSISCPGEAAQQLPLNPPSMYTKGLCLVGVLGDGGGGVGLTR
jgi:hypothetical protein